jgi:hypothetical protein
MSEQVRPIGPEGVVSEGGPTGTEPPTTGVASVDAVLADIQRVDALPLEDQLTVFERAHESLRAALDAPATGQPGPPA